MRRKPQVFISSTFFDLRQVRTDLHNFVEEELGYTALLSEHPSFPIDPDSDTIANSKQRVEENADVLLLVVGNRYGSTDEITGKSVTNLEYRTAAAKGIPIFVFVKSELHTVMSLWKKNPDMDLTDTADSDELLEFIAEIMEEEKRWVFTFDTAQDIVEVLRTQFAYLMHEGLSLRSKLQGKDLLVRNLRGRALSLATNRPDSWEYRLFLQVLSDETRARGDLYRRHQLGIMTGPGENISDTEIFDWIGSRFNELRKISTGLDTLMNDALQVALGKPGEPGDPERLMFVAKDMAVVWKDAIEWTIRVRQAHVSSTFEDLLDRLSGFSGQMIKRVYDFGPEALKSVENALALGEPQTVELTLELGIDEDVLDGFDSEIETLSRRLGV